MWNDLGLIDKARMIQLAVKSGITDLRTIEEVYNTYTSGGKIHSFDGGEIKKREDFSGNLLSKTIARGQWNRHGDLTRYYFGAPLVNGTLPYSNYRPSNSIEDKKYIAINSPEFQENIIDAYFNHPELYIDSRGHYDGYRHNSISSDKATRYRNQVGDSSTLSNLGVFKLGSGVDDKGQYISYYDIWDSDNRTKGSATMKKEHLGAGKPFEVYDRIYLDDYYGVNSAQEPDSYYGGYLSSITIFPNYSSGGKIHIKPQNRGKFTALKERTGHSASWFKEHGTPAQKKMAVFALNARKWKHEDGGPLGTEDETLLEFLGPSRGEYLPQVYKEYFTNFKNYDPSRIMQPKQE